MFYSIIKSLINYNYNKYFSISYYYINNSQNELKNITPLILFNFYKNINIIKYNKYNIKIYKKKMETIIPKMPITNIFLKKDNKIIELNNIYNNIFNIEKYIKFSNILEILENQKLDNNSKLIIKYINSEKEYNLTDNFLFKNIEI